MAIGAARGSAATLQVEMVCVDELVPADDRYRRLDSLVDWSFVREAAAPYYADEGGPSLDPIVLVKLALAGALEGIGSIACPSSHAHTRRFVDAQLSERLCARSVALCREHDLIDGTYLSIDGFHAEADAALQAAREPRARRRTRRR